MHIRTKKNGLKALLKFTDEPAGLMVSTDRNEIKADGKDLSFITVNVIDKNGLTVPTANNKIKFEIEGPGEILATDNGDPMDFTPFPSHERSAFSSLALVIIRSKPEDSGLITVTVKSSELKEAQVVVKSQ